MANKIEFENVTVKFNKRWLALDNVSFTVQKGDFVFLVGPTGAGKTTVLRLIYGDIMPDQGEVRIDGFPLKKISKARLLELRTKMGIVFQDLMLLDDRSVFENLAFPVRLKGDEDLMRRVVSTLKDVGLTHKSNELVKSLSRGEQQRLALARAMINEPEILLADEPFSNLHKTDIDWLIEKMNNYNELGLTVVLSTHNFEVIPRVPRARVLSIEEGRITLEH
ncbi:MAG TPA: ATP-binding cassette domain-containing protein [Candidatus Hydrothermia bacterium]|nr:ATP-binding cassette domain-containing protein [Candidatus Hydrothermae bacterium]MDD3649789.1 ATP-binding cassette domain-containing protein [Candidatus Hydrothermia bacterium]MDD5572958.1 ATP-binding cassette domain-containing protein [Candidatus Hydrothermia bacterium]HOK22920.1 ATP-binding cassette domain-containing protein [Candidatus Hydrothermia bacterium]HOL23629.1 ATP-binding cassette domain-containing protein [Candidatus Hydrothermia bacterium]